MIREFKKTDFTDIYRIGNSFKDNFSKVYDLNFYLNNDNYIVIVNEEELVNAFLIASKSYNDYVIEMIVVDELYRNKGIASNLLDYFIKQISYNNKIILEVASNNNAAINLYRKYNFNITNIRPNYYKDTDAFIMERVI